MCSLATSFANVSQFRDNFSPRTKRRLIALPNGCNPKNVTSELLIDSKHFTCTCGDCLKKWYICLNFPWQYTHYFKFRVLKRHQSSCTSNATDGNSSLTNTHMSTDLQGFGYLSYYEFMEFPHFGRNETQIFYFHNQNNQGLSYIVG